jgi:hypothetical protein
MKFNGPIPGQSLTSTPKNYPWERPPETTDPDEAITHHLTRLSQPKMLDTILDGISVGMPVSLITDMMLTGAVAKGIHSIDISLMAAPVIHEYIVNLLEEEGIEFKEFFSEDNDDDTRKNLAVSQAIRGLKETGISKEPEEELSEEIEPMEEEEQPKRGLMSREVTE